MPVSLLLYSYEELSDDAKKKAARDYLTDPNRKWFEDDFPANWEEKVKEDIIPYIVNRLLGEQPTRVRYNREDILYSFNLEPSIENLRKIYEMGKSHVLTEEIESFFALYENGWLELKFVCKYKRDGEFFFRLRSPGDCEALRKIEEVCCEVLAAQLEAINEEVNHGLRHFMSKYKNSIDMDMAELGKSYLIDGTNPDKMLFADFQLFCSSIS